MSSSASTSAVPRVVPPPPARHLGTTLAQAAVVVAALAILAWAWRGAEMRPLDLLANLGNSAVFSKDFLRPDFADWRSYLEEMVITVQIALWGTLLAVVAAIPLGLAAAANLSPWWLRHPSR